MVFNLFLLLSIGYQLPWTIEEQEKPKRDPNFGSYLLERVILFHQNVLSPIDGPRSHFRPTSARYTLLAVRRHGPLMGILMGCDRLLRENKDPWVYRTCVIDDVLYKWDPILKEKKVSHLYKRDYLGVR